MPRKEQFIASVRMAVLTDIAPSDDGYQQYWLPSKGTYLSAEALRVIADFLDELNKPWDEQVTRDLAKLPVDPDKPDNGIEGDEDGFG